MLRFFSKIRFKFAAENRPAKYLRYAIGEILLVVIGILIALQLNDCNENRKNRILEIHILKEIESNLNDDLNEIRSDIAVKDSVILACGDIIQFINNNDIASESFFNNVAWMVVNTHFDPNKSGYSLLVSKGVDLILNDNLRKSISLLYESNYSYYYRYEDELAQFKTHHIYPKLLDYFSWITKPELLILAQFQITQNDLIQIKRDDSFMKLIHAISMQNSLVKNRAERTEKKIGELMALINNELELKNNM